MEEENPKPKKARLIVHLGRFLVSHSVLVSFLCCCGGFVTLLLLPILAKNTYISENALMPGSANPTLSVQDVQLASRLVKDIVNMKSKTKNRLEIIKLIAENMATVGAEVYFHKNLPQNHEFHPLNFFSDARKDFYLRNASCSEVGISPVGIIRAPQGDGKESIVLVTPFNSDEIKINDAVTLGLSLSIVSLLSRVSWLAKDIIWLAANTRFGEYNSVSTWLQDYFNPVFINEKLGFLACEELDSTKDFTLFRRAGTMAAALVLQVKDKKNDGNSMDSLTILSEASNGQMPNLDLINTVHFLAVHRQAFQVKIGFLEMLHSIPLLKLVGETLELVSKISGSFNPQWAFGIPADEYIRDAATLASSIYFQALGVPTGSHGAFREYQIDAITLQVRSRASLDLEFARSAILLKGGRLIEGAIRSVNNLLEKFHQSFFLYLLTSPNKFVSVGVYMIPFALFVAPFPVFVAALLSQVNNEKNRKLTVVQKWAWIQSAKFTLTIHSWAALISLLPLLISRLPQTSDNRALTWVSLSIVLLLSLKYLFGSTLPRGGWISLKAVMISATSIGLGLMSIINFSTALIGALLLVPLCLIVRPLKTKDYLPLTFSILLVIISFPPAALWVADILLKGSREINIGYFWDLMENLWVWNSATYLYLFLVHLPCWVICVHVLFHP